MRSAGTRKPTSRAARTSAGGSVAPFQFAEQFIRIVPRRIVTMGLAGGPYESTARDVTRG